MIQSAEELDQQQREDLRTVRPLRMTVKLRTGLTVRPKFISAAE